MPLITFLNQKDSQFVSKYSRTVLQDLMTKSGVNKILITSTARTPHSQARVMYENIERYGIIHQKRLYGGYGDKVIDAYSLAKTKGSGKNKTISMMHLKILALGPQHVSRHAADPRVLNVIDIGPSSIAIGLRFLFEKAVNADNRVSKFLIPPSDPAYHLEIPQPTKSP